MAIKQKITIAILNIARKRQFTKILRTNLKNYTKTKFIHEGRIVWAKPDVLKKIYSRVNIGYSQKKGITEITEKKFVRSKFSLWRKVIIDEKDLDKLMISLKKRFYRVHKTFKQLPAERIGITIGTSDKIKRNFWNKETNRKRSKELVDTISTKTYERHKTSEEPMFDELRSKIKDIFFLKKGYTLNLDGNDSTLQALHFYVFFTEA